MANTKGQEVIAFFESSFADKHVLPDSLEFIWLRKAIAKYSLELDELHYDDEIMEFDCKLDDYMIETLAQYMRQIYQERQVSLVNKRVSIVGKDLSIDSGGNSKASERNHLEYISQELSEMIEHQKPSAYV